MPAWPALGAFFATALLLWTMASLAASAGAQSGWAKFGADILIGMAAAAAAGIIASFAAMAAMAGAIGIRRHAHGARSLRIALLTMAAVFVLSAVGEGVSLQAHWLHADPDLADPRVVPLLLCLLIAWPIAHLVGLCYGIAAQFDRNERPGLGRLGLACNGAALLLWYYFVILYPPTPAFGI